MIFGVACLYVMAYGTYSLAKGIVSPFVPKTINSVTERLKDSAVVYKTEDLKFRHDEGVYDMNKEVTLAGIFPAILDYNDERLSSILSTKYRLTEEEEQELLTALEPARTFEMWSIAAPPNARTLQRHGCMTPVIAFFDQIPDIRKESL